MVFRLNARYIKYELQNARTKRKGEEQELFFFFSAIRTFHGEYSANSGALPGCVRKPYLPMGPIREAEE